MMDVDGNPSQSWLFIIHHGLGISGLGTLAPAAYCRLGVRMASLGRSLPSSQGRLGSVMVVRAFKTRLNGLEALLLVLQSFSSSYSPHHNTVWSVASVSGHVAFTSVSVVWFYAPPWRSMLLLPRRC